MPRGIPGSGKAATDGKVTRRRQRRRRKKSVATAATPEAKTNVDLKLQVAFHALAELGLAVIEDSRG